MGNAIRDTDGPVAMLATLAARTGETGRGLVTLLAVACQIAADGSKKIMTALFHCIGSHVFNPI